MNSTVFAPADRLARLTALLQRDPVNTLLLADIAEAALNAGILQDADRYIDAGIREEGASAAWVFRQSRLRLAQHRFREARVLLNELRETVAPNPAIDHDLAYICFHEGDFASCAGLLEPWISLKAEVDDPAAGATQALWLRAKHHAGRLQEAWAWIEAHGIANVAPAAAGVASLIAVDLEQMPAADALSSSALQAEPFHPEALVARACVALAARQTSEARALLQRVTQRHPHQARAWSTFGFVDLLEMEPRSAGVHFAKALELAPRDLASLIGQGWAYLLQDDRERAIHAFTAAVEIDPEYADAYGGLAVAAAMAGSRAVSGEHATRARKLQPGNVAARYAQALATGDAAGLKGVQKIAMQLFGGGILHARTRQPRERG